MNRLILMFIISTCQMAADSNIDPHKVKAVSLITISVSNIKQSVEWYTNNLDFEVERPVGSIAFASKMALLKLGAFYIELIEKENHISQAEYLPDGETYLSGLFKIGFRVNNIEAYFNKLKAKTNIEFLTNLNDLPPSTLSIDWPSKYFLLKDPDGNFIQFFNTPSDQPIAAWLSMIIVKDLEKSIRWYENNLGFAHLETVGKTGNKRAIMAIDNHVLELFEPKNVIPQNEIRAGTEVTGFKKIAFASTGLKHFSQRMDIENSTVLSGLQPSDLTWAKRALLLADIDGNCIQLFELK